MNAQTNEDLVQDAMLVISEKYKITEFKKGILPWAYSVLDKIELSSYKKNSRRSELELDNVDSIKKIFIGQESTDEYIGYNELVAGIQKALKKLSDKEKDVFRLKLEGLSGTEIQEKLGLTREAFDTRVFRGVKKLRRELIKDGVS